MQSGLLALRQDNLEIKTAINVIKLNLERCFGVLNGNIRRIALQPARRRTAGGEGDEGADAAEVPGRATANDLAMMATLMPTLMPTPSFIMASVGEKPLDFSPTLSEVAQSIGTTDGRWCGTWCPVWFGWGIQRRPPSIRYMLSMAVRLQLLIQLMD
jgi:hypothetical protein